MKAPYSEHLQSIENGLKKLRDILLEDYDYVSILSTDSRGLSVRISQHSKSVSNSTMSTEKGTVVRVYRNGLYSEYSMDRFDPDDPEGTAAIIKASVDSQLEILESSGVAPYETDILPDEPAELFVQEEAEKLPEDTDIKNLVDRLVEISDKGMGMSEYMLDCIAVAQSTHVCKLFLSKNRCMKQSYVYSEGTVAAIVAKDGMNKLGYEGISGLCGTEVFDQLESKLEKCIETSEMLLSAGKVVPGEYEVITSPEVTGLLAHEAFGHGVEMDMFVKDRALGKYYIDKRVGSDLVTMHEGALTARDTASYAFDDEGTPAGDVKEIDHGILKTGICDALSAVRLGVRPTGNGKRENFEHKVYTRMTNTMFEAGNDTLEDMIASVKYGYLLEGMESGMEDPKHWGIQCVLQCGREIVDGKLTGKVVAPVIMTGYVPDLLSNVTMASKDIGIFGNGGCGKGYKEWVKVSNGGPYLKTKATLG